MGDARRKKLAGYFPEPVNEQKKKVVTVGPYYGRKSSKGDIGTLVMLSEMLNGNAYLMKKRS